MVNEKQINGNGSIANGHSNGHWVDENPEDIVLFTSESVGEGHPGMLSKFKSILIRIFFRIFVNEL